MASAGLDGPHDLTETAINSRVGASIGTYALGYVNSDNVFIVQYTGRSDTDMNNRLKKWLNKKYKSFKFKHFASKKSAFERECQIFHDFGGTKLLDNEVHPARPEGFDYDCPLSGCTDLD